MKSKYILLLLFVALSAVSALAQSRSYQALKDNFGDRPEVQSFSVDGWLGRMVLNMVGEEELRSAIKDLKHARFIIIPRDELARQNLSVNGFKSLIEKDMFQTLAEVREPGETVSIYIQEGKTSSRNRYLVLVEEASEIVAIELTGYLDPSKLSVSGSEIAINK